MKKLVFLVVVGGPIVFSGCKNEDARDSVQTKVAREELRDLAEKGKVAEDGVPLFFSGEELRDLVEKSKAAEGGEELRDLVEKSMAAEEAKLKEEATAAEETKPTEEATAAEDMTSFSAALEAYKNIGGIYPSTSQGLEALVKRPQSSPQPRDWVQALYEEFLYDPWDTKYKYKYPGSKDPSRPEIISAGPDKQFGSEDDMSSQK